MKSLILTVLYLAKDTVHRWKTRVSSPLARVLVVFFLSMCSLSFMATYVLSTKSVFDRIARQGADTARISYMGAEKPVSLAGDISLLEKEFDCEAMLFWTTGLSVTVDGNFYPVLCYRIADMARLAPLLPDRGNAVILIPERKETRVCEAPMTAEYGMLTLDLPTRRLPTDHLIYKAFRNGVVLVDASSALVSGNGKSAQLILRQKHMNYAGMKRIERYFRDFMRLERATPMIFATAEVLREMEIVQGNQLQCRAGFSIGIAVIVGILLTALASMEYRQNEYIYTLMKSFGIRPFMLVGAFIVENLLLVGLSLVAAVQFFMIAQPIVLRELFKIDNYQLTLAEIMPDVTLLGSALVLCVLVSAIPIVCAVRREIGRVLQ